LPLSAFRLSLAAAKLHAQTERSQGASWLIKELPAIVLRGDVHCVIITEIDAPTPLQQFSPIRASDGGLLTTADELFDRKNARIVRFVAETSIIEVSRGLYRTYRSSIYGPKRVMVWEAAKGPHRRPHAVNPLVRKLNQALALGSTGD
jgi:hypothetical protein